MKIENQCCSLEQAKRLKELGVDGISFFRHQHYPETKYRIEAQHITWGDNRATDPGETFSAFTVAELGEMIGENGFSKKVTHWLGYYKVPGNQYSQIIETPKKDFDTEAQARAEILIHLLENKLITASEVNDRLNK